MRNDSFLLWSGRGWEGLESEYLTQSHRCYMPMWLTPIRTLDTKVQVHVPGPQDFMCVLTHHCWEHQARPCAPPLRGVPGILPGFPGLGSRHLHPLPIFICFLALRQTLTASLNGFSSPAILSSESPSLRMVLETSDADDPKGTVCWHIQCT